MNQEAGKVSLKTKSGAFALGGQPLTRHNQLLMLRSSQIRLPMKGSAHSLEFSKGAHLHSSSLCKVSNVGFLLRQMSRRDLFSEYLCTRLGKGMVLGMMAAWMHLQAQPQPLSSTSWLQGQYTLVGLVVLKRSHSVQSTKGWWWLRQSSGTIWRALSIVYIKQGREIAEYIKQGIEITERYLEVYDQGKV